MPAALCRYFPCDNIAVSKVLSYAFHCFKTLTSTFLRTPHTQPHRKDEDEDSDAENEDDGDGEDSLDNLEGAYNARDYQSLNVASEVRDLFQYIERYKPHEVQLEAPLRCFIPDYIPAIGELDAFIKVTQCCSFCIE